MEKILLFPKRLIDWSFVTILNLAIPSDQQKSLGESLDKFGHGWPCLETPSQKSLSQMLPILVVYPDMGFGREERIVRFSVLGYLQ